MQDIGKILVFVGIATVVIGALLWSGRFPNWLGRLPGDLSYQNNNGGFSFYFPITTCILISVVLSLLSWLLRKG